MAVIGNRVNSNLLSIRPTHLLSRKTGITFNVVFFFRSNKQQFQEKRQNEDVRHRGRERRVQGF
jgi:hypothetical protein